MLNKNDILFAEMIETSFSNWIVFIFLILIVACYQYSCMALLNRQARTDPMRLMSVLPVSL